MIEQRYCLACLWRLLPAFTEGPICETCQNEFMEYQAQTLFDNYEQEKDV